MAAHWDYVRSWRPPREIHVRLDLHSRFSSRRYYEYQRESRLRPDSPPRVLDPVEVCSRRNRLLDERDSSARTVLRGRSRLQTESWRLCSRGLHRNNPRRHPFRNYLYYWHTRGGSWQPLKPPICPQPTLAPG